MYTSILCSDLEGEPTLGYLQYMSYIDDKNEEHKLRIIETVAAKWKEIGIALKFKPFVLDNIEATERGVVEKCSLEMFTQWIRGGTKENGGAVTWGALLESLKIAHYGALVEQIKKAIRGNSRHLVWN